MKIIFLTNESPFPPSGGAHIRDAHLIGIFRETMEVEVLCFGAESDQPNDLLAPPGVKITRIKKMAGALWKRAFAPFRPEVQAGYSKFLESALRVRAEPGKILWVSRLGMGKYITVAKRMGYLTVLDQHQVETQIFWNNASASVSRMRTAAKSLSDLAMAAQCGPYEGRICRLSDAVIATSDLDASRLLKLAPGAPVHIIPHAVDTARYSPLRLQEGKTLLFSGALNYPANTEALAWFLNEVYPRVQAALGTKCPRFVVAGSNPTAEIYRLVDRSGVELHANPPSLLPFIGDAAIVVVPMRSGRSMRFKILEAMAAGKAVLSTPRGSEGLVLSPGYDVWIAETADKFASGITRLMENQSLRQELGLHAAQTIDARYDWKRARLLLENLFKRLGPPLE